MNPGLGVVFGLLLAAVPGAAGLAAGDPDAARGIVAEYCTACHEVPGYVARHGRAEVNAPPFQAMADEPSVYTDERLRRVLRQPHFPMKRFALSPSDIDNLVAFIERLRRS
jgi:mono/diheme cytochrome c family protein